MIKGDVLKMASCEKCWENAGGDFEKYKQLIKISTCSSEEQAGENATVCPYCKRKTVHQYAKICMNPSCQMIDRN